MGSVCSDDWYRTQWFDDTIFGVLQPNGAIDCPATTPSPTKSSEEYDTGTTQFGAMVAITMIFGLLFILLVVCRSCNSTRTDWYRLIAVYIIGTLGVPISIALGPSEGGFNRVIGFGILVHNLAETFIIHRMWFGSQRHGSALIYIFYVWIIMTLDTFLPMAPLFFILMLQGAFCDYCLVYSFAFLGSWMDKHHKEYRKHMGFYGKLGTASAILHILSIQPLFFGIATTWTILDGITVIMLVPTFICYAWFSSADTNQRATVIDPSRHSEPVMSFARNIMLREMVRELHLRKPPTANDGTGDGDDAKESNETEERQESVIEVMQKSMMDKTRDFTYETVIHQGLHYIDPETNKKMWLIFTAALLTSAANSFIVFFSPCYINVANLVC